MAQRLFKKINSFSHGGNESAVNEIRGDFMIRGHMKFAFLDVMSRSPDLVVKRKNKMGVALRIDSGEHILK